MLYHLLYPLHKFFPAFNVFRYITFRTIYAVITAMVISFIMAPWFIRKVKQFQIRQYIREEGPKSHLAKAGTPTMGGVFILASVLISVLLWADLTSIYVWMVVFVALSFGMVGFLDDYLKIKRRPQQRIVRPGQVDLAMRPVRPGGNIPVSSPRL